MAHNNNTIYRLLCRLVASGHYLCKVCGGAKMIKCMYRFMSKMDLPGVPKKSVLKLFRKKKK